MLITTFNIIIASVLTISVLAALSWLIKSWIQLTEDIHSIALKLDQPSATSSFFTEDESNRPASTFSLEGTTSTTNESNNL